MKLINITDTIFATVNVCGRAIYNVSLSGISSIREVIRFVSDKIGHMADATSSLMTIIVRNSSQGWTERRSLRLGRPSAKNAPEGTQLSLF